MNIKILADSTCDLSPELIEKYNIAIARLTVVKGGEQFTDGLDITPADIFAHVSAGGDLCSTAACSIGQYQDLFAQYTKDYDALIHITISADFSACYQNACLAAEEFDNVRVIDSRNLTTGHGFIVLEACRLAASCNDLDEIVAKLTDLTNRVETSFLLDRLEYMVKGGRCSSAAALGANLLNLKPCIEVRNGKMSVVKKYRGSYSKCLVNYVKDRLADRDDIVESEVFLTHTPIGDDEYAAVKEALATYGHFGTVYETTAGCTVSCHCGPGTLGIIFLRK